jgi:hypothetical protein
VLYMSDRHSLLLSKGRDRLATHDSA